MLSRRMDRAKQSLLNELDKNFQRYFHANLGEVINDLRLHYVEITYDPTPDELLSVIERSRILDFVPGPPLVELRDTIHRIIGGTFGVCIACKRPIAVEILESAPNAKLCPDCSQRVNQAGIS